MAKTGKGSKQPAFQTAKPPAKMNEREARTAISTACIKGEVYANITALCKAINKPSKPGQKVLSEETAKKAVAAMRSDKVLAHGVKIRMH